MGGSGSTRWNWHYKKTMVEDCLKLTIYSLKPYLYAYRWGNVTWTWGGRQTSVISFLITGQDFPESIRLIYTHTDIRSGEKTDLDYSIPLTWTLTPWRARRYWFTCPLCHDWETLGRRVGALYLPPGRMYFGCRHCYNLTYRSSQIHGEFDSVYRMLAGTMQECMPGVTAEDMRYMWDRGGRGKPPKGGYFDRINQEVLTKAIDYLENIDPYARYLAAGDICAQSGLTLDNLAELNAARLLLPDHDGKYRPKVAGWARKLAYLLRTNWTIEEIKGWSKGRWAFPDPRQWPPRIGDWKDPDRSYQE